MQSHNHFTINLDHQKARAKKLLKAIKKGDKTALDEVKIHQSQPEKITLENIKLADVQFAIARQLGLPSWHKLKAHVDELTFHRNAIATGEQPLDSDMHTLHVRCGHDIQQTLKRAGFHGDFLPLIDPLCIGPIPKNDEALIATRAAYVVDTLLPVMGEKGVNTEIEKIEANNIDTLLSGKYDRVVLWVEHDSYDQFMLLRALNLLANDAQRVIEIIEINDYPGTERFIGLGQLPGEAVRACWKSRKPVSAKLLSQASYAWKALRSATPESLVNLLQQGSLDSLPNLPNVIRRHLQELPNSKTGLSMTQQLGLSVLQSHSQKISFGDWFRQYQKREPLPFLGDTMFYAIMLPLSQLAEPLFTIEDSDAPLKDRKFAITLTGMSCLAGNAKAIQEYWVGGIYVCQDSDFSWDHRDIASLC